MFNNQICTRCFRFFGLLSVFGKYNVIKRKSTKTISMCITSLMLYTKTMNILNNPNKSKHNIYIYIYQQYIDKSKIQKTRMNLILEIFVLQGPAFWIFLNSQCFVFGIVGVFYLHCFMHGASTIHAHCNCFGALSLNILYFSDNESNPQIPKERVNIYES